MTQDYRLLRPCPHRMVEELYELSADYQTIRLRSYVASQNQVYVRMDAAVDVPPEGLQAPAASVGSRVEPFVIQTGVNDKLSLSVNRGVRQTVTLYRGDRVSAVDLASFLNSRVTGVVFTSQNGHLGVTSEASGDSSSIRFQPVLDEEGASIGTAHVTLGFKNNYEIRGRTAVPSWHLERQPNTVEPLPPQQIRFSESFQTLGHFFEVSYYTVKEQCRRCAGLGLEYDFAPDKVGDPQRLKGADLLMQMVEKIVLTSLGSDPFNPWYGTQIAEAVGKKALDGFQADLQQQVMTALSNLQSLQQQQQRLQNVTDDEFLAAVHEVNVERSQRHPTLFLVRVSFSNRAGRPLEVLRVVNYGSAADLLDPVSRGVQMFIDQATGLLQRG